MTTQSYRMSLTNMPALSIWKVNDTKKVACQMYILQQLRDLQQVRICFIPVPAIFQKI
jgi:hypothetical protein